MKVVRKINKTLKILRENKSNEMNILCVLPS